MTKLRHDDTYHVTLDSGDCISYQIRGLREDEIGAWADFCASVFSYKPNPPPPAYFERHYRNDPTRVASLIRVAFWNDQIVASCRLFLRTLALGLSAGGIGEVCTAHDHRRRGLSKVLLQNVMDIMKEHQLQISLLHAAPAFFPVYETVGGYVCSTSSWSLVPISTSQLLQITAESLTSQCSFIIREASFPKDTDQLSQLHRIYSEERFAGCLIRSNDYWNEYLSQELQGSLWVLETSSIVAWLSLRPRGTRFQLQEFGFDKESSLITLTEALTLLLQFAVQELQKNQKVPEDWILTLPTFVLDECCMVKGSMPFMDWSNMTQEDDFGWMYKILDNTISIESINGSQKPHFIWPADSF